MIGLDPNQRCTMCTDEAQYLTNGLFKTCSWAVSGLDALGYQLADLVTANSLFKSNMNLFRTHQKLRSSGGDDLQ